MSFEHFACIPEAMVASSFHQVLRWEAPEDVYVCFGFRVVLRFMEIVGEYADLAELYRSTIISLSAGITPLDLFVGGDNQPEFGKRVDCKGLDFDIAYFL